MKMRQVEMQVLQARMAGTLMATLGMEFLSMGPDWLEARMPVDARTHQIHGVLHGGATAALIESLGSVGAALCVDTQTHRCVGVEINANHLRSARSGWVTGRAKPLHVGRTLHVWQVDVVDDAGKLVCTGRLTVAVLANAPA